MGGTDGLLIRHATVVDGTGSPAYPADVLVEAGRIAAISTSPGASSGARQVDASGLVLAPGFIDMHAHSDLALLFDPAHTAKISQGVTFELLGQDGLSFAPIDDASVAGVRTRTRGWNGGPENFEVTWRDVAGYLDRLDSGIACHAGYLVPQGTLRMMVVGEQDRVATPAEQAEMCALLRTGLAQGALGMSSGLTYPPGMYADTAELLELCRVVAEYDGIFSPHHRSYGRDALGAYAEMIELARDSRCRLHLTHATMNFPENRGQADELLALIDTARTDGVDISLDSYPYLAGATTLSALLPSWAFADGEQALRGRLASTSERLRIRHELEQLGSDGCHGCTVDWHTIRVSGVQNPALEALVGLAIDDIARQSRTEPADVFFDLLLRDGLATSITQHVGDEQNVQEIMRHAVHCGGSDAILTGSRPHPRAWGTFPRYLRRYVRELGVLTLEDCVAHLTGRPANRLRLRERGFVRVGYHADLVLFDPATIRDTATFEDPKQQAEGIVWVWVGGTAVLADGRPTHELPGRALRRTTEGACAG